MLSTKTLIKLLKVSPEFSWPEDPAMLKWELLRFFDLLLKGEIQSALSWQRSPSPRSLFERRLHSTFVDQPHANEPAKGSVISWKS